MQIVRVRDKKILAVNVVMAGRFWQRMRGWLGYSAPPLGHGLFLYPCQGVHTLGMRFALDAVYLDKQELVLRVLTLKPWRVGPWVRGSYGVLELPAGTCAAAGCQAGDQLCFQP
ncbi:DUF192 domain-containing protein [bacterium]|nr:DUF192 domain-containing protein [bacterium]